MSIALTKTPTVLQQRINHYFRPLFCASRLCDRAHRSVNIPTSKYSSAGDDNEKEETRKKSGSMTFVNTGARYHRELLSNETNEESTDQLLQWSETFDNVNMNGNLHCDFSNLDVDVQVLPTWSESLVVQYHATKKCKDNNLLSSCEYKRNQFSIIQDHDGIIMSDDIDNTEDNPSNNTFTATDNEKKSITQRKQDTIKLFIPEHFNIALKGRHTNVTMCDKLQGSVIVDVQSGDIEVNKVRGTVVNLSTGEGSITVLKVAEGAVQFTATHALKAKTLMGPSIQVKLTQNDGVINVGAMYAYGDITIGSMHGRLSINECENVQVDGMSGSANIDTKHPEGNVKVHFDKLSNTSQNKLCTGGDISITFTSPVKANLNGSSTNLGGTMRLGDGMGDFEGTVNAQSLRGKLTVVDVQDWDSRAMSFLPTTAEDIPTVEAISTNGGNLSFDVESWLDMMSKQIGLPVPKW